MSCFVSVRRYGSRTAFLCEYTAHVDAAARGAAAKLLGLAASSLPDAGALLNMLAIRAAPVTKSVKFEEQEGALMALGAIHVPHDFYETMESH